MEKHSQAAQLGEARIGTLKDDWHNRFENNQKT
jgi:hypothetical protein